MKILKLTFLISLILFSFSSKGTFRETTDAHFFKAPSSAKDAINLLNKLTSSMSYGIWTNQILNGSGNKYLPGPLSTEIEGQQFLRIFSLFDLALTTEMKKWEEESKKPKHFLYLFAPIEKKYMDDFQNLPNHPLISKTKKASEVLFPRFMKWPLKKISSKNIIHKNQKTFFSLDIQNKLNQGLEKRLNFFWKHVENLYFNRDGKKNLKDLHSLYQSLFIPFAVLCEMQIDKEKGSSYKLSLFLPSLFSLERSHNPTLLPFVLKPGIEMKLPIKVETPMAKFLSANYLKEGINNQNMFQHARKKLIKIELTKYFNKQDEVLMSIKFGSLWKKQVTKTSKPPSKIKKFFSRFKKKKVKVHKPIGLYPIDLKNMTDGIGLDGFVNFPFLKEKSKVNKYFNQYKMRVFINRLNINLKRPKQKSLEDSFKKNLTFTTLFDKKNSLISFRLKKEAEKKSQVFFLEKILGFKCIPKPIATQRFYFKKNKFDCFQDLSTIKDFKAKYSNDILKRTKRFGIKGLSLINFRHTLNDLSNRDIVEELKNKSPELVQEVLKTIKESYDSYNLTIGTIP